MGAKEEIAAFLAEEFPQGRCRVEQLSAMGAKIFLPVDASDLRPGKTISGPTLMLVADVALYVAILNEIGLVPLAVTSNLTINFLRKPAGNKGIRGVCTLLKVGRTLAIGEVSIYSDGSNEPVAHAVGTYVIPSSN